GGLVDRLRALHFATRAYDVALAAPLCRFRLQQLTFEFGDFEFGDDLALFHSVADINIDFSQIPGDLRVQINLLEGAELRRERQPLRQVFPFDPGYRDCEGFVRAGFRIGLAILLDRLRSRQSRAGREG